MRRRAAAWAAAAVVGALAGPAGAVPVAWPAQRFDAPRGAHAADALQVLARVTGVAIEAGAAASCRFDPPGALPPQRFVEAVAAACGLAWYYDGAVLQLTPPAAFRRVAVRLNYATPAELRAALARQKIVDPRWPPGIDDATRIARIAGPSRYVELVLAAARALDQAAQARVRTATRAVRLRARDAADRTVRGATGETVLPGLASQLRRRLEQDGARPRALPDLVEFTTALPIIDADARSNTVLIRDVPSRLDADARLLARLDTMPTALRLDVFGASMQSGAFAALGLRAGSDTAAPRVTVEPAGCAALRARLARLAAHGEARVDVERSTLTAPDGSADFEQQQRSYVATDGRVLNARRAGFAMRITPREAAEPNQLALDMRMVERWVGQADGDARDTSLAATLAPGACAVLTLPGTRDASRVVLVSPGVVSPGVATPGVVTAAAAGGAATLPVTTLPVAVAVARAAAPASSLRAPLKPVPTPTRVASRGDLGFLNQTRLIAN
ncbi:secretion protein [Burkholderia sp. FERM BP-3421]|uniref:secretion protein n=1 Tax=Burkholderia sp. FERM BP-3421 TaxID=1494466 RepID=UPI00235EB52C|nr:secretion protein [Burkholderia sp. FERM BP-3421]WDD92564.1 secretion protein [Burkholderia sp. FERM BP-3421]